MKPDKNFKELFSHLEAGHISLREELNSNFSSGKELENFLFSRLKGFEEWRYSLMDQLGLITSDYDEEQKNFHKKFISQTQYYQIIQEAPFYWRIINKPNGYAGDAFMMNFIYRNRFEGETPFGKLLHKHALETKACKAVRNRKFFLKEQILKTPGGKILSLAAGPAEEIKEVLEGTAGGKYHFHALDHDMDALISFNGSHNGNFEYFLANAFQITAKNYTTAKPRPSMKLFCSPSKDFKGLRRLLIPVKYELGCLVKEDYDLIYSAGLYDYFKTFLLDPTKGTIALTKNLFELLKSGGTLIIGNFSGNNPRDLRFVMEYIYDWNLIYRNKEEMFHFARSIPEDQIEEMDILEEPLGINYFLKIVKK